MTYCERVSSLWEVDKIQLSASLFFNDLPKAVPPSEARVIGLNEALTLQGHRHAIQGAGLFAAVSITAWKAGLG